MMNTLNTLKFSVFIAELQDAQITAIEVSTETFHRICQDIAKRDGIEYFDYSKAEVILHSGHGDVRVKRSIT